MPEDRIIVKSAPAGCVQLPGALVLPDAKRPVPMGSGVITSLISTGGMAIIYEIWNPDLEVRRAVKLLHPDHTKESEDRFQTEMKITAKLHHPNIVEIYGVGKWNGLPYIEMERIDGQTLERLIAEQGVLPIEVCTSIGLMVGRALQCAHNQTYILYGKEYTGIIHRDLKPSNIMVTTSGVVKLMDFGIAKPMTATIHTSEGMVVGTMQYLAPEQLDGKEIDIRADIYSLGTVLYETLTGVRAFPESNLARLVPEKLSNTFRPLEDFSVKIPPQLIALVHRCMRQEPERRIPNTLEFLRCVDKIHRAVTTQSPEQVMASFMHRAKTKTTVTIKKRVNGVPFLIGALTAALLCCAGIALWFMLKHLPRPAATLPATSSTLTPTPVPLLDSAPVITTTDQQSVNKPPTTNLSEDIKRSPAPKPDTPPRTEKRPVNRTDPAPQPVQIVETRSASAPPVSEIRSAASPLIQELSSRYATGDLLTIMETELQKGNHVNARTVYERIDKQTSSSQRARILLMRLLKAEKRNADLRNFFSASELNEAEFLLEKGTFFLRSGNTALARDLFARALSSPCEIGDAALIRQSVLFNLALCASASFDEAPGPDTKKSAMEAWFTIKSTLRSSPGHEYYRRADEEIRRINSVRQDGQS